MAELSVMCATCGAYVYATANGNAEEHPGRGMWRQDGGPCPGSGRAPYPGTAREVRGRS
jgi:hypothetical protein